MLFHLIFIGETVYNLLNTKVSPNFKDKGTKTAIEQLICDIGDCFKIQASNT